MNKEEEDIKVSSEENEKVDSVANGDCLWIILEGSNSPRVAFFNSQVLVQVIFRNGIRKWQIAKQPLCPRCDARIQKVQSLDLDVKSLKKDEKESWFVVIDIPILKNKLASHLLATLRKYSLGSSRPEDEFFMETSMNLSKDEARVIYFFITNKMSKLSEFSNDMISSVCSNYFSAQFLNKIKPWKYADETKYNKAIEIWGKTIKNMLESGHLDKRVLEDPELLHASSLKDDGNNVLTNLLLDMGMKVTKEILRACLRLANYDLARKCLQTGIDLSGINAFVFVAAQSKVPLDVLRMMIKNHATPDTYDREPPPIFRAFWSGNFEVFKVLVEEANADLRVCNSDGEPIAFEIVSKAIRCNDMEYYKKWLEVLVKGGARIDAPIINTGVTVLHEAIKKQNWKGVHFILDLQQHANIRDNFGRTPLHYAGTAVPLVEISAALCRDEEILTRLLCSLNSVDSADFQGETPLHWAAAHGNLVAVRKLVEARADLTFVSVDGKTPMEVAKMKLQEDVYDYLKGIPLTLKSLCLRFISKNIELYADSIPFLPTEIQERLPRAEKKFNGFERKKKRCIIM